MATIARNKKALAERPLKTSQATGASLATLGFNNAIPLMHGSQGCGAFAKVYLIQHFREPMPIQNTAVDQIAAVMGSDQNILQALELLTDRDQPEFISLLSTGLTEMQGSDISRNVQEFEHNTKHSTCIAAVPCPDFVGSLQTGFANTLDAILKKALHGAIANRRHYQQVNLLCSSALTPADIEQIKVYADYFDLELIVAPDISNSLDGHLQANNYSATSTGGTTLADIKRMPNSAATLCIGESVYKTGQWLESQFDTPCYCYPHLMGLDATDALIEQLSALSGKPIPLAILRARQRLQDTLLDTHFVLASEAFGIAQETDLAAGFVTVLAEMGCDVPIVVTTGSSEYLKLSHAQNVMVGDHSDLDPYLDTISLLIGNTHCAEFAEPQTPVFRAGYPCHDRYGNADQLLVGYQGTRATLNQLANMISACQAPELQPFVSPYAFTELKAEATKQ